MRRPLILIAEDDRDDRFLLESAFKESGNDEDLHFVENGVEVMLFLNQLLQTSQQPIFPDLMMIDLNMPKKNGKEILAEVKQHSIYKNIPIIVYTTTSNEADIKKCYELGANTYIVKPTSYEGLREVVSAIKNYWLGTASIPVLN
jgi:CheY-like chemotaxis protein